MHAECCFDQSDQYRCDILYLAKLLYLKREQFLLYVLGRSLSKFMCDKADL